MPLIFIALGTILIYKSIKKSNKVGKAFEDTSLLLGILPCNNDCVNCKHYKQCNDWEICNENCRECEEKNTCKEKINKYYKGGLNEK